jgi:hypothetical protein
MTDLTPEQIEQWAGDATAKRHYARQLKATLERVNLDTLLDDTDLARLHAHALHLQQQATIERLTALIDEHNRRCSQHPLDRAYMIDTQDGVK